MKMLKLLTVITLSLGTAQAVQAQQQEEKTAKPLPAALTRSPATENNLSAVPVIKQIPADAAVPATPLPSNTTVITEEMKAVEIKPGEQKGHPVKNADRPKTSTIEPVKKTDPAAKPMPVIAIPVEG